MVLLLERSKKKKKSTTRKTAHKSDLLRDRVKNRLDNTIIFYIIISCAYVFAYCGGGNTAPVRNIK